MGSLSELKEFFAKDAYATSTTGIEILSAENGCSKLQLHLDGRHKNALGFTMGAVYFTMADFAFAVATNSSPLSDVSTITLSSAINMMNSAKTDLIFAEAFPQKDGRLTCFYHIDVYEIFDGKKRVIATTETTGYKIYN